MERRGNPLLDTVVIFAMLVTATAFAAALLVHAGVGMLPAAIAGAAILMLMIASHLLLTRFAQGGDAERMDDFEQALEIIDGDLQRIDKMEEDVARLDLLTDKIEQFDRTLSSFEAANLSRLSSDVETMQARLETLRAELEVENRSQREELNTELRLLERLMKQLSIDLAATEGGEGVPASGPAQTPASEGGEEAAAAPARDYEPIDLFEAETSAADETAGDAAEEPIDMTAAAEPERHEAGAWEEEDRQPSAEPAERSEEAWEEPASSEEPVSSEAAAAEELAAADRQMEESEVPREETVADEQLPPEDSRKTQPEQADEPGAPTAETEPEETLASVGEDDAWPAPEEQLAEERSVPGAAAEPASQPPIGSPGEVVQEEALAGGAAPAEDAPEESELEADLGRVEAAETEAGEHGAEKPTEERDPAAQGEENDELVLTDLVVEERDPETEPAKDAAEPEVEQTESREAGETDDSDRRH